MLARDYTLKGLVKNIETFCHLCRFSPACISPAFWPRSTPLATHHFQESHWPAEHKAGDTNWQQRALNSLEHIRKKVYISYEVLTKNIFTND